MSREKVMLFSYGYVTLSQVYWHGLFDILSSRCYAPSCSRHTVSNAVNFHLFHAPCSTLPPPLAKYTCCCRQTCHCACPARVARGLQTCSIGSFALELEQILVLILDSVQQYWQLVSAASPSTLSRHYQRGWLLYMLWWWFYLYDSQLAALVYKLCSSNAHTKVTK